MVRCFRRKKPLSRFQVPQGTPTISLVRIQWSKFCAKSSPGRCSCGFWEAKRDEKLGLRWPWYFLRHRRRSNLCWGPFGLGLRPLRWPCLPRLMDLASEAVEDKAQVCAVCFGFMGHATSSWTNSPNWTKKSNKNSENSSCRILCV